MRKPWMQGIRWSKREWVVSCSIHAATLWMTLKRLEVRYSGEVKLVRLVRLLWFWKYLRYVPSARSNFQEQLVIASPEPQDLHPSHAVRTGRLAAAQHWDQDLTSFGEFWPRKKHGDSTCNSLQLEYYAYIRLYVYVYANVFNHQNAAPFWQMFTVWHCKKKTIWN